MIYTRNLPSLFAKIFIHSQFAMALSAAAYLYTLAFIYGANLVSAWYFIGFCGVWSIYMLDAGLAGRPIEDEVNNPVRFKLFQTYKTSLRLLFFFVMLAGMLIGLASVTSPLSTVLCIFGIVIAAIYALPIVPFPFGENKAKRFKEIGVLKPVLISLAWTICPFFLFIFEGGLHLSSYNALSLTLLFLILFIDCCQLDEADIKGDQQAGIKTLSNMLSPSFRYALYIISFSISLCLLSSLVITQHAMVSVFAVMLFTQLMMYLLMPNPKTKRSLFTLMVAAWRFAGCILPLLSLWITLQ